VSRTRSAVRKPLKEKRSATGRSAARPWYEEAFTRDYLERYAHRSDDAARREVPFVLKALKLKKGAQLLDLCCGAGRHSRAFDRAGMKVTGLDLSHDLLEYAESESNGRIHYVQSDMRTLPFKDGAFDAVANLFTSFGYFDDGDNQRVLSEVSRVLKPGGLFLMDYLNMQFTLANLVAHSQRDCGGACVDERRKFDTRSKRLNKVSRWTCDGETKTRRESVRAYSRADLEKMLRRAGMTPLKAFGDLVGATFIASSSPRCVMLARKMRARRA
jgi:ubiquinone/menaquinone biosynthesis C-methylase UbiE